VVQTLPLGEALTAGDVVRMLADGSVALAAGPAYSFDFASTLDVPDGYAQAVALDDRRLVIMHVRVEPWEEEANATLYSYIVEEGAVTDAGLADIGYVKGGRSAGLWKSGADTVAAVWCAIRVSANGNYPCLWQQQVTVAANG